MEAEPSLNLPNGGGGLQEKDSWLGQTRKRFAVIYNYLGSITPGGYLAGVADHLTKDFFLSIENQKQRDDFDFFICSSNSPMPVELSEHASFSIVDSFVYRGRGWDIGAYVFAAERVKDYDLAVFMNSQARFSSPEALVSVSRAWTRLPFGILGFSSSFEVSPHIRTSAFAIPPKLLLRYPNRVSSRYDACVFEHSPESLTNWAQSKGLPTRVIYTSGVFDLADSRRPSGVFRSSDQSLILISDRHTRLFAESTDREKAELENRANNIPPLHFRRRSRLVARILRLPIEPANRFFRALASFPLNKFKNKKR